MKKFIWLIGENEGNSFNNNSFYYWDHIVLKDDDIDKYFVVKKNKNSLNFYDKLDNEKKKFIVWKNTYKHFTLFKNADMYFVSLSFKDITPDCLFGKNIKLILKKPLIYLQHGTLAIKKLGYTGNTYYNNMFNFVLYNKLIKKQFSEENDFKDYQLYYAEYHPRYKGLAKYHLEKNNKRKKILFFITWREYFGDNFSTKVFINELNQVFENEKLLSYIKDNDIEVELFMHQFYDDKMLKTLKKSIKNSSIKLLHPGDANLMKELATCDLLITDYSSVGFDASILKTPVILFQPDYQEYFKGRDTYCTKEELALYNITSPEKLVDKIISGKYKTNEFFTSRIPDYMSFVDLSNGVHIDNMYNHYKEKQYNKITILGYNYSGTGGTVSATKALAESLLEAGYLVELKSLKITTKNFDLPYGISCTGFYDRRQNKYINMFKRHNFISKKNMYYFNNDINKKLLSPYIGKALKKFLNNTNSKTIISTRESIHLFVHNFANNNVKNKVYFFHTDANVLNNYYPGLVEKIKDVTLDNCVFVTSSSKESYKEKLGFVNYKNSFVIGNGLESSKMTRLEDISLPEKTDLINVVTLIRLSKDRQNDVNNIIEFGKYLKSKKDSNIKINVYGGGDLSEEFMNQIIDNKLETYIWYYGPTDKPKDVILASNCVVDFCNNQSFGMTYIESILNGRMVFAKENVGSLEVLKELPELYYHSNKELYEKILNVNNITKKDLINNYKVISNKYSRENIADEFKKIINKD